MNEPIDPQNSGYLEEELISDVTTPRERLEKALGEADSEKVTAALQQLMDGDAQRIFRAIENGLASLEEIDKKKEIKIETFWKTLAEQGIKTIEDDGSLAPGLSHQDIFVKELKGALANAERLEDFQAGVERLKAKWGSKLKYPLFAGGRRKELGELLSKIRKDIPAERVRMEKSSDVAFRQAKEKSREATRKAIHDVSVDFHGLSLAALKQRYESERVIRLRWLLIQGMNNQLFKKLFTQLGDNQAEFREFLYYAVERIFLQIFCSFKDLLQESSRTGASTSVSARTPDIRELSRLEIQRTQSEVAALEQHINSVPLHPQIIAIIKEHFRAASLSAISDPKVFAEMSGGLRPDFTFGHFLAHLKKTASIDERVREEIVTTIKTSLEPFRSLYYAKITLVRYLKGLQRFRPVA